MKKIASIINIEEIKRCKECSIDTVSIGFEHFSSGVNMMFNLFEIKKIHEECLKYDMNLLVVMNKIFFDEQLTELKEAISEIIKLNAYIEYTDPAIFNYAKEFNYLDRCVYNPDTLLTNRYDVQLYLDLGLYSVVLGKEITLDKIKGIVSNVSKEVVVNAFGYQSMSYTKRPLLKNYLKFIDKEYEVSNRKDLYLVETTRTGKMPIIEEESGTRIFTEDILFAPKEASELNSILKFDGIFLDREFYFDCLNVYKEVSEGKDVNELEEKIRNKYPNDSIGLGYLYQDTSLVKVDKDNE